MSWQARTIKYLLKKNTSKKHFDPEKVKKHRSNFDRNMRILFPSILFGVTITQKKIAEIPVMEISTSWIVKRTIIYAHGGGFVFGSSKGYQQHLIRLAKLCKANVISIDYSLSPESPFPIALNEIQKVWQELLKQGLDNTKTVIMGDSAGASLALGTALKLRDTNQKQPACLVLLSPAFDATFSGKSYSLNKGNEVLLNEDKMTFFVQAYAQQHPINDPYISLVFADLTGIPPFLIHVGSEEMLLSDSETVIKNAKRDNVNGTLYIGNGMWHGWHLFASYVPEAKEAMKAVAEYIISRTT